MVKFAVMEFMTSLTPLIYPVVKCIVNVLWRNFESSLN